MYYIGRSRAAISIRYRFLFSFSIILYSRFYLGELTWKEEQRTEDTHREEKDRQGQRKGKWRKIINRYGIILHLFITLHFFV